MDVATDPQTLRIRDLTASWQVNDIRPNPEYQRGSSWKRSQQQLLIDSIFRGYPLPRFYFQRITGRSPLGREYERLEVIDGQQRLIALSQFVQDMWPLLKMDDDKVALPGSVRSQPAAWAGKTFSDLPDVLRDTFLDLELPVVLIDDASSDEVRDLFIRLQAGTPLTTQQVRDAWPGNIGPYIEQLAGKRERVARFATLFRAIDRRGQGGRTDDEHDDPWLDPRQTCAQLLLLLLSKEAGRALPTLTSKALDQLYHEGTSFDTHGQSAKAFEQLLTDVTSVVERRPAIQGRKTVRKGRIFSLFMFLRLIRFSNFDTKRALPLIAQAFWDLGDDDTEPVGRVGSAGTLTDHFHWLCGKMSKIELSELDQRRTFDTNQKREIHARFDGRCGVCQSPVRETDAEYDHVWPWILGGRTDIDNGRPVHPSCHARGLAAVDGRATPIEEAD